MILQVPVYEGSLSFSGTFGISGVSSWELTYPIPRHFWVDDVPFPFRWDMYPFPIQWWIWRLEATSDENRDGFLDMEKQLGSSRFLKWMVLMYVYAGILSPFGQGFKQKHPFEDVTMESIGLNGNMMWFFSVCRGAIFGGKMIYYTTATQASF